MSAPPGYANSQRSWRDRIFNFFRPSSPASFSDFYGRTPSEEQDNCHEPGVGRSSRDFVDPRTRLLDSYESWDPACGRTTCNHGTFSPRPEGQEASQWGIRSTQKSDGPLRSDWLSAEPASAGSTSASRSRPETMHSESSLAATSPKRLRILYYSYYVPFINWITQYRWFFLRGDFTAALTIASMYIPMILSMSENLAHAPPVNGLYSFVICPLIYAVLGSSPLLVVGPEAAGSLLTGTIVKSSITDGLTDEDDQTANATIVGVTTAMAGAMVLIAGLTRLGFLDNVLSRPFLRGFITAIGFTIFIDQLVPELGLLHLAKENGASHGSTVTKIIFILQNIKDCHALTVAVALGSFSIIMMFRILKRSLEPRYPQVVYFPDRFLVVIFSAILTWKFGWDKRGLEILGAMENNTNGLFEFRWPFKPSLFKLMRAAMSTSFVIAILGFFESSVAAKGIGEGKPDGVKGMAVSANREMVALGVANVVSGCFMGLPAFGGYGRSKVNASTGAHSPMSSIFLSLITLLCILVILPYLYYLPKAVLCSMISVVAVSLVEECPHDVAFFIRLRGWSELTLMLLIFLSTIFYSLEMGIALGIGLSVLILIRHSTQPRIQILGRVTGTDDRFDNAEIHAENVELVEGALIVKIPEPLTFANTGDLKNRLRRLELYGSSQIHPSLPRMRPAEYNQNIIFDVHGVTSIDGSGTQVLFEIVKEYADSGVRVFFCRVPTRSVLHMFDRSGIVDQCGGTSHFVRSVDEALKLAETEGSRTLLD